MNSCAPTFAQFQTYQPGAALTEQEYAALLPDAEAWTDAFIFPNSVDGDTDADVLEAYQRAVSAVVSVHHDFPGGVTKSYASGKVREDYDEASIPTAENAAAPYLSGSGLLCRWL